jgi:hypothetical protein
MNLRKRFDARDGHIKIRPLDFSRDADAAPAPAVLTVHNDRRFGIGTVVDKKLAVGLLVRDLRESVPKR